MVNLGGPSLCPLVPSWSSEKMMRDRARFPSGGRPSPAPREKEGPFAESPDMIQHPRQSFGQKKNDNRKGITRHRQNVVSSQKQRVLREFCLYVVISHSSDMDIQ